jgi:hypothetical protein
MLRKKNNPFFIVSITACLLIGCTKNHYYAGRQLPKAYLANLVWDLKQTKSGAFLHVDKIDGESTWLNSEGWITPGVHEIQYSCITSRWNDHYPDTAKILVRHNRRYGMLFSGFDGSPYPHPHPECDLDTATPPCIAQELIYLSVPTRCQFKLIEKEWSQAEFSQSMPLNRDVLLSITDNPRQKTNNCNSKNPRSCASHGLGRSLLKSN